MKTGAAEEYKAKYLTNDTDIQYLNMVLEVQGEGDYSGASDKLSLAWLAMSPEHIRHPSWIRSG